MKRLLIILLILISTPVYAIFGIGGEKECPLPPPPEYYSIHVLGNNDEPKVFYVFKITTDSVNQVGIIDEPNKKIIEIKGLKILSTTEYATPQRGREIIEMLWGALNPIEFYQQ